jgi:hypothetical protein
LEFCVIYFVKLFQDVFYYEYVTVFHLLWRPFTYGLPVLVRWCTQMDMGEEDLLRMTFTGSLLTKSQDHLGRCMTVRPYIELSERCIVSMESSAR